MPKLNEQGVIAQGLILLLLLAGIGAGIYLVQHPQIFRPKADVKNVEWIQTNQDPDNCVSVTGNDASKSATASCPKVKFKINVQEVVAQ